MKAISWATGFLCRTFLDPGKKAGGRTQPADCLRHAPSRPDQAGKRRSKTLRLSLKYLRSLVWLHVQATVALHRLVSVARKSTAPFGHSVRAILGTPALAPPSSDLCSLLNLYRQQRLPFIWPPNASPAEHLRFLPFPCAPLASEAEKKFGAAVAEHSAALQALPSGT